MDIKITFSEKNTSSFDLGRMTIINETGDVVLDTGLSMPWIDLCLLIWCLERLALRGGTVTFCSSASSFEMEISLLEQQINLHGFVYPFREFATIVLEVATQLLVAAVDIAESDVGRLDLAKAVQRFGDLLGS